LSEGRRFRIVPNSSLDSGIVQSHKVADCLARAIWNEATVRKRRLPVVAVPNNASKGSSFKERRAWKIKSIVKAMRVELIWYRRIVKTSVGSIGIAHAQPKSARMTKFATCKAANHYSPNSEKNLREWLCGRVPLRQGCSRLMTTRHIRDFVIGQATLASFPKPDFVQDFRWEAFAWT
jgi:hypothetical protein